MSVWQLIKTPWFSGLANMDFDLKLFHDFEKGNIPSTLRVYSWRPRCVSIGYTQKISGWQRGGWEIVKRPTGGGVVYHEEGEISYSIVTAIENQILPSELMPSYARISEAIICGLRILGITAELQKIKSKPGAKSPLCFEQAEVHEIISGGKKIVGSAQKRGRKALLQQGAIKHDQAISYEQVAEALRNGFEEVLGVKFNV